MKTVLIVDNDQESRQRLSDILDSFGLQVLSQPDAKYALSLIRKGASIDLLIIDYGLPEMDGFEFVILAKQVCPEIPIIMLTDHNEVEPYLKSMNIGVFAYLDKPVSSKEVGRVVNTALMSSLPSSLFRSAGVKAVYSAEVR